MPLPAVVRKISRHTHFRVISSFAVSQGIVFVTSLARIPLVVAAIGSDGYGVAVAVTSLQAWVVLVIISVMHLTQVSVAEDLGRGDFAGALQTVAKMRQRARQLVLVLGATGIVLAVALPWPELLHAKDVSSALALRAAICAAVWLLASGAPGAVYLGVMNAERRVALTQSFPGIGAVLGLAVTAVGWAMHLGLFAFVMAPAIAACAPFWLSHVMGRKSLREIAAQRDAQGGESSFTRSPNARPLRPRDLLIMSGAGAPPLYSTGLDPIILSISTGPAAVAAYGLASRLGLLVTMLPSALYPLYWANFSRLRAAGDIPRIWEAYRRELLLVVAGTALLGILLVAVGPTAAHVLSDGKIDAPILLYSSVAVLGILAAVQTVTLPLLGGSRTAPKVAGLVFGLIIPNEALSYVLSRTLGASGPILASIAASLVLLGMCFFLLRQDPTCIISQPIETRA
jgi:O-antigen/teichoic acid export membrane protein